MVMPWAPLMTTFSGVDEAVRIRQERFIAESRSLTAQRDALLPGLVSGEVRVGN